MPGLSVARGVLLYCILTLFLFLDVAGLFGDGCIALRAIEALIYRAIVLSRVGIKGSSAFQGIHFNITA